MPSIVHYDGLLYMTNEVGIVTALDAATGARVWQHRLGGVFFASPVAGDGKVYFVSETGETFVLKAGRTPEVLATNDLGERFLASPAIAARPDLPAHRPHAVRGRPLTTAAPVAAPFRNARRVCERIEQHGQTTCSLRGRGHADARRRRSRFTAKAKPPLPPLPAPLGIPAPGAGHRRAVRAAADPAGRHRRAALSAGSPLLKADRVARPSSTT